jgi:hypothetical protein
MRHDSIFRFNVSRGGRAAGVGTVASRFGFSREE